MSLCLNGRARQQIQFFLEQRVQHCFVYAWFKIRVLRRIENNNRLA